MTGYKRHQNCLTTQFNLSELKTHDPRSFKEIRKRLQYSDNFITSKHEKKQLLFKIFDMRLKIYILTIDYCSKSTLPSISHYFSFFINDVLMFA